MRRAILVIAAALLAAGGLTACDNGRAEKATPPRPAKIGVILPDSRSNPRWEAVDRPALEAALNSPGIPFVIQNAQGDPTAFRTLAEQMIASGVTVLVMTTLDAASGRAVIDTARAHGVTTIDYDRLTLGGGADYYVGFDNVQAGTLVGQGLAKCLADRGITRPIVAQLGGPATDDNATLLRQGYESVLGPKYRSGDYVKGPEQAVPSADRTQVATTFQEILDRTDHLDAVVAASDTVATAVISVLRVRGLAGALVVTGQDATVDGLRQVLAAEQCMTVYKPARKEATAVADLAVALGRGQRRPLPGRVTDPQAKRDVPAVVLAPRTVVRETVKDVVADGFVSAVDLCTPNWIVQCRDAGIR
jgi:D-xylose transport system substrate-binding protein